MYSIKGLLATGSTGAYLGGFWKPPKIWLAIKTTIDHHPRISKSMKQQTILCLAAQIHVG